MDAAHHPGAPSDEQDGPVQRPSAARRIVVAHPSAELFGSDRQLRESVLAFMQDGTEVHVYLPEAGPLQPLLEEDGAAVFIVPFPVLRKAALTPRGLVRLLIRTPLATRTVYRASRGSTVIAVYVSTITIPWWLLGARLARRPVLCHVHEAENEIAPLISRVLLAPLWLADAVIANSKASADVICASFPRLSRRLEVIYNGVVSPTSGGSTPRGATRRLALVGRISPRKGTDVALEAVSLLNRRGYHVSLDLCGSTFTGYEWFEKQLRERSEEPDLAGLVTWHGYVRDVGPLLSAASAVLVPSRQEPFGNAAVEAQLAGRPVVVSSVQGLCEIVDDRITGLLVAPGDPESLAAAVALLLDDRTLADRIAAAGQVSARRRFSVDAYRRNISAAVGRLR